MSDEEKIQRASAGRASQMASQGAKPTGDAAAGTSGAGSAAPPPNATTG